MENKRAAVIYMVEYLDDVNQKHITFVMKRILKNCMRPLKIG